MSRESREADRCVAVRRRGLVVASGIQPEVVLLALVACGIFGGCAHVGVAAVYSGGDAPPFAKALELGAGRYESLGAGDTVALLGGRTTAVVPSNAVCIEIVASSTDMEETGEAMKGAAKARYDTAKDRAKADFPAKAQKYDYKQAEHRAWAEKDAGKGRGKVVKRRGKRGELPGELTGPPRTQSGPLVLTKEIRTAAGRSFATHLSLRRSRQSSRVVVGLTLWNRSGGGSSDGGTGTVEGRAHICDRLPERMTFVRTLGVKKVRPGSLVLQSRVYEPASAVDVNLREAHDGALLKYDLDYAAGAGEGLMLEYEVEVDVDVDLTGLQR